MININFSIQLLLYALFFFLRRIISHTVQILKYIDSSNYFISIIYVEDIMHKFINI